MKKKFSLLVYFVFLSIICFSQAQISQLSMHNSCATAKKVCFRAEINETFDSIDSCNQALEPVYWKLEFGNSGHFSLTTTPISLTPQFPQSGTYTMYGPINSFGLEICQAIELGQVQEQVIPISTTGVNNIGHQEGIYILKIEFDHCLEYNNPLFPGYNIYLQKGMSTGKEICFPIKPNCQDCITSFSPDPGEYIISGWVMGADDNKNTSYTNPFIDVSFVGGGSANFTVSPSGPIIDGWQKVEGVVSVPPNSTEIIIQLDCLTGRCYFDDIRFVPIDGSMKSYVYDPITLRLVAELDERNYATFYEYDEEGKLIRVKKETEKGIMTIQENRNSIVKQ